MHLIQQPRAEDGKETFTYNTVAERMPSIVKLAISNQRFNFSFDSKDRKALEALQDQMRNNKRVTYLSDGNKWNQYLTDAVDNEWTWHSAPWWLVENYMYRRITEVTDGARVSDPFEKQKEQSLDAAKATFDSSIVPLLEAGHRAHHDSSNCDPLSDDASSLEKAALNSFFLRSLWGNKADLSISAGVVKEVEKDCTGMRRCSLNPSSVVLHPHRLLSYHVRFVLDDPIFCIFSHSAVGR